MREPHRAVLVLESKVEDVERLLADLDTDTDHDWS